MTRATCREAPSAAAFTASSFSATSTCRTRTVQPTAELELEGQQFLPYFNETRVLALFVSARFAIRGRDDRVVPFYLLPKLGGNFALRGFNQYRFHDNNAFIAGIEHRWYAFTGLEMAAFVDAGKTVSNKGEMRPLQAELQRRHRVPRFASRTPSCSASTSPGAAKASG